MGFDLSATLGFGICIYEQEDASGIMQEAELEEVYDELPDFIEYVYGGSDGYNNIYLLHIESIVYAGWAGSPIVLPIVKQEWINNMIVWAKSQNYDIKEDKFSWYLVPKWF